MKYSYNHFMQQYEKELIVAMVTVAVETVIIPKIKGDGLPYPAKNSKESIYLENSKLLVKV